MVPMINIKGETSRKDAHTRIGIKFPTEMILEGPICATQTPGLKHRDELVDYYTKLSDFHAQFRAVGTNYNQVVKELRLHFSEKKAMALLYKLEQHTVELVKLSRRIVELSREMEAKWSQKSV